MNKKGRIYLSAVSPVYGRGISFKRRCLIDISRHSLRLHILASLPTSAPESAGLCALGLDSIVSGSLPIQRPDLTVRIDQGVAVAKKSSRLFAVAVRGTLSSVPDSLISGRSTRVQLPPFV
jgi:hypothetical protein